MPSTRIRLGLYMFAPLLGGAERYLRDLLRGLHIQPDFETTIFYNDWPAFEDFLEVRWMPSLRAVPLRSRESGGHDRSTPSSAASPEAYLRAWLRARIPAEFRTTLWQIRRHGFLDRNIALIASALRAHMPLNILHVINGGYPGAISAQAAVLAAQQVGVPVRIMSVCSTPYPRSRLFWWEARLDQRLQQALTQMVVPARFLGNLLVDRRGFNPEQWTRIPYGVAAPPESWAPLEIVSPPDTLVIGMLSNLVPGKGHADLLRAAAMLRQGGHRFQLVVVGDGPLRPTLSRLAEQLSLAKCVTFTGYVRDIYAALARFDIVVLPSEIEGLPYVILEAMSLGKAIVASAVGGIPEALPDGAVGLLVPPKDVPALANAVGRLLTDPSLRLQLGRAACARYQETYTLDRMFDQHLQLYRRWNKP